MQIDLSGRAAVRRAAIALATLAAAALWGCGAGASNPIELVYTPQSFSAPVQNAEGNAVRIAVSDARRDPANIGQIPGAAGPLVLSNDPRIVIRQALEQELEVRGFNLGANAPAHVNVELTRLSAEFQPQTMRQKPDATVELNAAVAAADGRILYTTTVSGHGESDAVMTPSSDAAATALDRALDDAIARLLDDPRFTTAIVLANTAR